MRNGREWPEFCQCNGSICNFDAAKLPADLQQKLQRAMPGSFPGLAGHEWQKHGVCSGLSAANYFAAVMGASELTPVPAVLPQAFKTSRLIAASALRKAYGGDDKTVLRCTVQRGQYLLTAVRSCWKKSATNERGERISCPQAVRSDDNCTAAQLFLTPR